LCRRHNGGTARNVFRSVAVYTHRHEEWPMSGRRVIGIVLAVVGLVLLYFGITASDSLVDQASKTFTGRFTQQTMIYIILGVVALVGGGLTALSARR